MRGIVFKRMTVNKLTNTIFMTDKDQLIEKVNLFWLIPSFSSLSYDRSKASSKAALHTMRSRDSSFKWQYPLFFWRSSSSFLRLLPRLHVTSIVPFIFPSITHFRRHFLRKIWPIRLAFRLRCCGYRSKVWKLMWVLMDNFHKQIGGLQSVHEIMYYVKPHQTCG